ncbi:hypothetical protein RNAN_0329 [Rheinheimera nanhaiensis E407-8]|uniref:Uncharacterized protein n=1 Tax=Rheinheimera nanhaiensis E407-8 TaxID=562729 RepID=I1DTI8_9GAMM|nr:hypothetical protein RNAN_0329 [Rheinheimera nanhaiensis E407-8]
MLKSYASEIKPDQENSLLKSGQINAKNALIRVVHPDVYNWFNC